MAGKVVTHKAYSLLDRRFILGEGPAYDGRTNILSWVDIKTGSLFLWDMNKKQLEEIQTGQNLGAAVPTIKGKYIAAMTTGIYFVDKNGLSFVCRPPELTDNYRLNDAKCDPAGRFWFGTCRLFRDTSGEGSLFRLDPDRNCYRILKDPEISNGLAWSDDKKTMYYIDTPKKRIDAFDYELETGSISNRRQVIDFQDSFPDGMTIDSEGKLWVALWGGNKVVRCDPASGKVISEVQLPSKNITSCCFAGENLDTLFITSSGEGFENPETGRVFYTQPGVQGTPTVLFDDTIDFTPGI
jgi:sugar lactone lactonase YvrE